MVTMAAAWCVNHRSGWWIEARARNERCGEPGQDEAKLWERHGRATWDQGGWWHSTRDGGMGTGRGGGEKGDGAGAKGREGMERAKARARRGACVGFIVVSRLAESAVGQGRRWRDDELRAGVPSGHIPLPYAVTYGNTLRTPPPSPYAYRPAPSRHIPRRERASHLFSFLLYLVQLVV